MGPAGLRRRMQDMPLVVVLLAAAALPACSDRSPREPVPPSLPVPPAQPAPPAPPTPPAPAAPVASAAALLIPVPGIDATMLRDTFEERRGTERHEALDIPAPRGTPVRAVADGRIVKLFTSKPGGLTVYQFDIGERYAYYYAHLDRYAEGLAEGQVLKRGDPVGTVGSTGNASPDAPHLHFAVFELGPERQWWKGTALNPYPLFGAVR